MNFYTLISKKPKKWILSVFIIFFSISFVIIGFNFIIDPYNITKYNILNIKYKFARDDRTEKLRYFNTLDTFDNIMIGSSRVYSMNPKIVSDILGGTTYNFGIGTASVEDHLGILKYLVREDKLPKNIILGVDFYTFNPDIPPNKYFIKNKELNFLSYSNYKEDYLSKLYSIDSFRASVKTFKNHLFNDKLRSRFDKVGWCGYYEDYTKRDIKKEIIFSKKEVDEEIIKIYSNFQYKFIDNKRVEYYNKIRRICKENNIKLYIFNTPLNPLLLNKLYNNKNTNIALIQFLGFLNSFDNFKNMYYQKEIYSDLKNFKGATHMSTNAGDLILKLLIKETKN